MKEAIAFIELIDHICKRSGMYTGGSVKEILAFIEGYRYGNSTPISGRNFDRFVCIRNSFPSNYVWTHVVQTCSKNDDEAFEFILEIITEYVRLRESMSDEELMQFAAKQTEEEEDAAKIFRAFDRALLTGNEKVIKSLIQDHKDASILWKASYPEDVVDLLKGINSEHKIKCIPISEDGSKLNIIAQGWPFPIEMNFLKGEWKIDAHKIIEIRKSIEGT